jgi:hypothetical protein
MKLADDFRLYGKKSLRREQIKQKKERCRYRQKTDINKIRKTINFADN